MEVAAKTNITKAQDRQKASYKARHTAKYTVKTGDKVLLRNMKRDDRKGGKVSKPWLGPYKCLEIFENNTCRIEAGNGTELKKRYNIKHLCKYHERQDRMDISVTKCKQNHFKILPFSLLKRKEIASKFSLTYILAPDVSNMTTQLGPKKTKRICGDGNCFFRSISYIITGTEENHSNLRKATSLHLGEMNIVARKKFLDEEPKVYLERSKMANDKVWATEKEIFTIASLLSGDVFVYSEHGNGFSWLRYPCSGNFEEVSETSFAIVHRNSNHFEPVIS